MLDEKNDNLQEIEREQLNDIEDNLKTENQIAIDSIENSNAEESEDETLVDRYNIPILNYETMSMDELVVELEKLVSNEKIMSIKDHVEEIRKEFISKYNYFIDEKKEEYLTENKGDINDFEYHLPVKTKFDTVYNQYKDKKNTHFKNLQTNLKNNLEKRLTIIEELKGLINPEENIKDTLKQFNELRERWKNAGSIPRDKYNHVWNNYHFHVENFYDYLHLDREARDLDFKYNLELKNKIIDRVQELLSEEDISKAFRELQILHKIWKEEIGPVAKEYRNEIWEKFSALTKQLHDKREALVEKQKEFEVQNLKRKQEIIAQIETLATQKVNSHALWQEQIEKIETLRNAFFNAGKVPIEVNEDIWATFKTAVKDFNTLKNSFYKEIKKDQQENLNKKIILVEKAKALQNNEDYAVTTPIMKQIQEEWKAIGHVPRKYSDKIWKEFKTACNHYFDKLHTQKNEVNKEEIEAFDKKKAYIDTLKAFELTGNHKTDLDAIKAHIEIWKSFGKVPFARRHVEGKFNKILDALFDKLSLSKKDTEMVRFNNRMDQLVEMDDTRKLENEKIFLIRKIDEIKSEILQLENNIQFITSAKKNNPFVIEVEKSINKHKEDLQIWKAKLQQIRNL